MPHWGGMTITNRGRTVFFILAAAGVPVVILLAAVMGGSRGFDQTPLPAPALSLEDTAMENFRGADFTTLHSPVGGDENEFLIFGGVPVTSPPADLPPEWSAFLGRWEGFSYGPPVRKDWKFVLVVEDISSEGGTALLWFGTNLQYPEGTTKVHFRTVPGNPPSIEWKYSWGGANNVCTVTYDTESGQLEGRIKMAQSGGPSGPIRLDRGETFHVYQDYPAYLATKSISSKEYTDPSLAREYGAGFLLHLPEGYADGSAANWPLIFFLHGYGDRGTNVFLLAKASPFMMIREKGPLPFIIVAPLLKPSSKFMSFPEAYMDGVLEQILADYRVDRERIYVTGISIGGEATYRFALHQPDMFAAIAPLASYLDSLKGLEQIKDLPVWAIHGADDIVVPLSRAQQVVDALKLAGGNVRFSILENHDHDVWTDTYLDPLFYEWLLVHRWL
jgi:predicted esterase